MPIIIPRYETHHRQIQVGNIDPGFQQALIRNVGQDAAASTAQAMFDAGKQLTEIGIKEYVSQETARVSQALQEFKTQLSAEHERYTTTNQGQNALGAGEHFDSFALDTASPLANKFSGKFRTMFIQDAAATSLRFTEQGQAYANQQEKAWKKSAWDGDLATSLKNVADNVDEPGYVRTAVKNLKGRYMDLFPGMDYRAVEAELNQKFAGTTIDSFLARNDVGKARAYLNEYKDILGATAPQYEHRINSLGRELQARARAEQEMRFVSTFAADPLQGIAEISTPEGQAKYGLDAKAALGVRSMLQAQWNFNKQVEKERRDTYITDAVNGIYATLTGDPSKNIPPDPAKAYQDLQNSNLDALTKLEMGRKLEDGTIGKTRDAAAVNDMARLIIGGEVDSDAPIDVMLAQGKASVGDVAMLKGMRKDMDGPLKDYLKRGDALVGNAFARPQFAAGTPEAAIKEDRARNQLQRAITEAYKKGGPEAVEKLFSSDLPMSIMSSNAVSVDDELNNLDRVLNVGRTDKRPIENANEYLRKRLQGGAQ